MEKIMFDFEDAKIEMLFKCMLDEAWEQVKWFGDACDVEINNLSPLTQVKYNCLKGAYNTAKRVMRTIMRLMDKYMKGMHFNADEIKELNDLGYNYKFVVNEKTGKVDYISNTVGD